MPLHADAADASSDDLDPVLQNTSAPASVTTASGARP